MAAYAALLSLMHTLHHIKIHPRPPISLHQKHVDSITQGITFLQHFLEHYSSSGSEEDECLESRIAYAAHAAEDVIESHIVDQIHAGSNISTIDFCLGLERAIRDMDLIRKEVMEIIKDNNMVDQHHDQHHRNSSVSTASARPASTWQNSSTTAGFDDVLINEVLDKLTGQQDGLQIFSIVGMGGIGKTTFARNIYSNPLTVQHFDILAWVTISQEYNRGNILQFLCQEIKGRKYDLSRMSEEELGEILYKHLWGRRYLVVMDDIWSIDAWYKVKSFFPNNNHKSRIIMTTRLSNLAFELSGSHDFQMKFLDEDKSWDLLRQIVFGKKGCPNELENIGKEIAENCRGLPLSIVVIGGLLTKSNMTREYWQYTLNNLTSLINSENYEYCLQVLHTSYKELPIHLKPCFLYMGAFPEDDEICSSNLIKLWVAEGILKPIDGKSLEELAEEYLKELIDRNLILVSLGWDGKAKLCRIHDLLRDLCLREAQKQRFLCVLSRQEGLEGINMGRRICLHGNRGEEYSPQFLHALDSALLTRSLLSVGGFQELPPSLSCKLLRVFSRVDEYGGPNAELCSAEAIFQQANLRYASIYAREPSIIPTSWSLFWNLQTIKIDNPIELWSVSVEIWEIPLLRHVVMFHGPVLPDPRPYGEDDFVLKNLQTLARIRNFKLSEEVVKRIPNIKTLKLHYTREDESEEEQEFPNFYLNNLSRLQKLEHLNLRCFDCRLISSQEKFTFPHSLKKLSLYGTEFHWEELSTVIAGSLPLLEFLRLTGNACRGPKWETSEGKFCSLKFLRIEWCSNLKYWDTDSTHFPRLEHLVLQGLPELEEIPSSIGDISTLKSIKLECCSESAADSATTIKSDQVENGNEELQVLIKDNVFWDEDDEENDDDDEFVSRMKKKKKKMMMLSRMKKKKMMLMVNLSHE